MEWLLRLCFRRMPIGWYQLKHNRTKFIATVLGVAFANILIFMQLGFLGALTDNIVVSYKQLSADILIYSKDSKTFGSAERIPRQRMFQALGAEGVASATPIYIGMVDWDRLDGTNVRYRVIGFDPDASPFTNSDILSQQEALKIPNQVLVDSLTRKIGKEFFESLEQFGFFPFEMVGNSLEAIGTFTMGGGFDSDGQIMASDQTFFRLFPQRSAGTPNYILITLKPNANKAEVVANLKTLLSDDDMAITTLEEALIADQKYQLTQRPIGIVFGFGVIIGLIVGMTIIYQVLATDVNEHIHEYATFKAIGYPQSFFRSIILEQALILAVFGFIPGLIISMGLYVLMGEVSFLILTMTVSRAAMVIIGTIITSLLSGILATRKLAAIDPADLF